MERVTSFKFLGISKELSWSTNTVAVTKKAQQQLHFLRILRKSGFGSEAAGVLLSLCHCATVWYTGSLAADRKALQRVIRTAQRIIGREEEIGTSHCVRRSEAIISDPFHPAHHQLSALWENLLHSSQ